MKHIVYIHGFASVGKSDKSIKIQNRFPHATVHMPTFVFNPRDTIQQLNALLSDISMDPTTEQVLLVGTSLGGFYARVLSAYYDIPAVLINPLIDPQKTTPIKAGVYTNYASGEVFEVTDVQLDDLVTIHRTAPPPIFEDLYYFANADDDVIDAMAGEAYFNHARHNEVFPTGGHRFADIDRVFPTIAEILNID